jgi:hypothetical protein
MSLSYINNDKTCIQYTTHCARSRDDFHCMFCNIDTSNFTKNDWSANCTEAMNQNIHVNHNYQVEHIQGMAVREQDYVQVIYYRCANCKDTYVERDDQR